MIMTATAVDIGTLITRSPEIRDGRLRIAGTGVTVQRIVGWYKLGLSPEEMADRIGHLTLAQIHAALAYYHANREEIEAVLVADEAAGDQAERETSAGWDDLPEGAKVVGKRHAPGGGMEVGDGLQRLVNDLGQGRVTWPKGVWRFKTHEEAEAWWLQRMRIRK